MKLTKYTITSDLPLFPFDIRREPGDYVSEVQARSVSDGYHTFDDLYEHRNRLFIALCKIYDNYITPLNCKVKCWKSKLHDDGGMFDGDFIMGMTVEDVQPFNPNEPRKPDYYITYHLPLKYWGRAKVMELPRAPKWDGHTAEDVLERLLRL